MMTDNEIIKAQEYCCEEDGCDRSCPLFDKCKSPIKTMEDFIKFDLDLINRLQSQNKDLSETVHNLTIEKDTLFDKLEELKAEVEILKEFIVETRRCDKEIKSETVKEFAERLKENISDDCRIVSDEGEYVGYDCDDVMYCINNLVKEFEKKENTAYDD